MSAAEQPIWCITHDEGLFGVYATRELAEQHVAKMPRPDEFTIEQDVLRTEVMPLVADWDAS